MSKRVSKPSTKAKEASSSIAKSISKNSMPLKKGKEKVVRSVEGDKGEDALANFQNPSCEDWFHLYKTKKFVVEKSIAPNIDEHFHIIEAFSKLGWQEIFNLHGEYYPQLVLQFNSNIKDKTLKLNDITSRVQR